jgi:hypothetical protein
VTGEFVLALCDVTAVSSVILCLVFGALAGRAWARGEGRRRTVWLGLYCGVAAVNAAVQIAAGKVSR